MDVLSTEEAAARLGVSSRRVRALIEQGDLEATRVGHSHLIQPESLARLGINRASGRSLSARTSWVALLSDLGTCDFDELAGLAGLSRSERARVLALRQRRAEDWSWLARRRATTKRYAIRDTYLARLLADRRVVRSGLSAIREHDVDLTEQKGTAEVYVDQKLTSDLPNDYLLRADALGGVIVHAVDTDALLGRFGVSAVMTAATVGVDLAESDDMRTRRAGYELLGRVLRG
jgi:excisionase family DNA binding protein